MEKIKCWKTDDGEIFEYKEEAEEHELELEVDDAFGNDTDMCASLFIELLKENRAVVLRILNK